MPQGDAHEKFTAAVETLATSDAPLRERLLNAYLAALTQVTDEDVARLAEDLSGRVTDLLRHLEEMAHSGLLTIDAAEARRLANEIVHLDRAVARDFYADHRDWLAD